MQKIVMYWRDIPSLVIFKKKREKGKAMLPSRFQEAIDRAAMRAGKGSSDLYIEEWRREVTEVGALDLLSEAAVKEASILDESISDELLKKMVKNNGFKPENE